MHNKKLEKALVNLYEASKITDLYRKMQIRGGKPVLHRGSENPELLFIGEAGGKEEDKQGIPFVGRSGIILNEWMKYSQIKEIAVINAVPIMPENCGSIRKPTKEEIEFFRPYVNKVIASMNPKYIILVGRSANEFYSDYKFKLGEWIRQGAYVGFIYHPSYYMRSGQNGKKDFIELMRKRP